jgi:hypothetical protein
MGIFAVHPEAAGSPKAMAKLDEKMEQCQLGLFRHTR